MPEIPGYVWLLWFLLSLIAFLILEGVAIANGASQDTLSENVWRHFINNGIWRRRLFFGVWVLLIGWLSYHFLSGGRV